MMFRYFLGLLFSRILFVLFIISHQILINTLASLGICERACDWFQSYVSEREQIVCVNDAKFDPVPLNCGVPQGSVGGPTLFFLSTIVQHHNIHYYCYADDFQLHVSLPPEQEKAALDVYQIEVFIDDVRRWMSSNYIKTLKVIITEKIESPLTFFIKAGRITFNPLD